MMFQHTAARRRLPRDVLRTSSEHYSFNTQPPEGGCSPVERRAFWQAEFQHTAARRRLPGLGALDGCYPVFQHTAARRRLQLNPD